MLDVVLSNRFKKDLKLAAKRGLDLDALTAIVDQLAAGQPLPDKNRDHALTGDYIGFRECHIRPDWLLVFRVDGGDFAGHGSLAYGAEGKGGAMSSPLRHDAPPPA